MEYNFPLITLNDINCLNDKSKITLKLLGADPDYNQLISIGGYANPAELKYNFVEARNSSIHGKGVFATEDIPKNAIITFYPAHAIKKGRACIINDTDRCFKKNIEKNSRGYSVYLSLKNSVELIGNPNNTSNPLLLGHMINDASKNVFEGISINETKNLVKFKNKCAEYYMYGSKKRNCAFLINKDETVVCVVASRDINKGEEILTYYDPMYWFNITFGTGNDVGNHAFAHTKKLVADKKFMEWVKTHMN